MWNRKEIKIQSYALVQLVGRELNKLPVQGILRGSALKIRSKMAVKQHAPGLDSRIYSIQESNSLHLETVQQQMRTNQ